MAAAHQDAAERGRELERPSELLRRTVVRLREELPVRRRRSKPGAGRRRHAVAVSPASSSSSVASAASSTASSAAASGAVVVFAGMVAPPNLGREWGAEFNAIFPELAAERRDVLFYPFFLEGVAAERALNQADGIHPNAEGVREIVRRITPTLSAAIARLSD